MIDGRIAFLKAELKIAPAQEPAWNKVAQAMQQNAAERRQLFEQARANRANVNALQALERRARVSALRAQQTDRFLAAFRPLYDSLSAAQKQTADELLAFRGRHGHFHRRG
ncbi:MAG: Spy/CpxP family protein refolding chaperone [Stellaceae bacterium]